MNTEIEIELKTMLTLSEYQKIFNYYTGIVEQYEMYYLYFDAKKGNLIRIKKSDSKNVLTLKTRLEEHKNIEKNIEITNEEVVTLLKNPELVSNYFSISLPKQTINKKVTITRKTIKQPDYTIMLDKTKYANNSVDYEIEAEFQNIEMAPSLMVKLLTTHQITYEKAKTKIERTIEKE